MYASSLILLGIAFIAGNTGNNLMKRLHIPSCVIYLLAGLAVGRSGLRLLDEGSVAVLLKISYVALAVVGFHIGGGLRGSALRKYERRLIAVFLAESLASSLLAGAMAGGVVYLATRELNSSVAAGLLLGAIAAATAPFSTMEVFREKKARGVLTAAVRDIVVLDDALAIFLFSTGAYASALLIGSLSSSLSYDILRAVMEVAGSVGAGVAAGWAASAISRRMHEHGKYLPLISGVFAVLAGGVRLLGLDLVIASVAMGAAVANLAPNRSVEAFHIAERFTRPVYILFLMVAGACIVVESITVLLVWVALAYVVGRMIGKYGGAYLGADAVGAPAVIRRYLGLCLFGQTGVAMGLAVLAASRFAGLQIASLDMGQVVITAVSMAVVAAEFAGPVALRHAVLKAGEAGHNVTEEDLYQMFTLPDMIDENAVSFVPHSRLSEMMEGLSGTNFVNYIIVDESRRVVGQVSLESLRYCLSDVEMGAWLVAADLMDPVREIIPSDMLLSDAVQRIRDKGLEAVPVVDPVTLEYRGIFELRSCEKRISQEVWRRRRQSDREGELV